MKPLGFRFPFALLALAGLLSGGCASMMTKSFPDTKSSLKIVDSPQVPWYGHDWPPGAYQVPDTSVYIARLQGDEDTLGAALLFGVVGNEVAGGQIAKGVKKDLQGAEEVLHINLQEMTNLSLQMLLSGSKEAGRFTFSVRTDDKPIRIISYAVFSYVDDVRARLWMVLKVDWFNSFLNDKVWYCRYISGVDTPRPLAGKDSWTANDGELMRSALSENLKLDLGVFLDDLNGKLKEEKSLKQKISGRFMFYKNPLKLDALILRQTADWDVILPLVSDDSYYSGVNIVPKDFIEPTGP